MALIIKTSQKEYQWHTNAGDLSYSIQGLANEVVMIQADGDELQHIYKMFSIGGEKSHGGYERPEFIPKGKVIKIFGDLAKTIVANLNNL